MQHPPVTVVVPLVVAVPDLLRHVGQLAALWPEDLDGRLVVAAPRGCPEAIQLPAELEAVEGDGVHLADLVCSVAAGIEGLVTFTDPSAPAGLVFRDALSSSHFRHAVLRHARDADSLRALLLQLSSPRTPAHRGRRPVLSAALIVKDEQRTLPLCLHSLRGHVDELVVCDTGSSDATVAIAEAFGAVVVHRAWDDDFATARNAALDMTTGTWVLSIDADEQLVVSSPAALQRALSPRSPAGLGVLIRSDTDDTGPGGFEHEALRLFRREGIRWAGAVHESLIRPDGSTPDLARLTGVHLRHTGYLRAVYAKRDKTSRNLALAEQDHADSLAGRSARPPAKASYELARALQAAGGDAARVEALLREALAAAPADLTRLRTSALVRLSELLRVSGRAQEASDTAGRAVALAPADPAAALALACALVLLDKAEPALAALDTWSVQTVRDDEVVSRSGRTTQVDIPSLRGVLLHRLGRSADALAVLEQVAQGHPGLFGHWDLLVTLIVRVRGKCGWQAVAELRHLLAPSVPDVVEAAAVALEQAEPALALTTWQALPRSARQQVGAARCFLALEDPAAALAALDGLEPADLEPADLLTVALLAAWAGDRVTAQDLLDAIPGGELDGQVEQLRRDLSLSG